MHSLLITSVIFFVFIIYKKGIRGSLLNPYLVTAFYLGMYLVIPSIFLSETSEYYKWNFSSQSIFTTQLVSLYYFMVVTISGLLSKEYKPNIQPIIFNNNIIKISLIIFIIYILIILKNATETINLLINSGYDGREIDGSSSIKLIAYALIPISVFIFRGKNKEYSIYYICVLLIIIYDLINGTRTIAFIALFGMLVSRYIIKNDINIFYPVTIVLAIYSIGIIFRVDGDIGSEIPSHIKLLGEFRETLNSYVYLIDNNFEPNYNLINVVEMFGIGVLGPARIFLEPIIPGQVVMNYINRGYGFGFSILTESYYYLGFMGVIIMPFILLLFIKIIQLINFKNNNYGIATYILFCILIRLVIREGIVVYSGLYIYLSIVILMIIAFIHAMSKKNDNINIASNS